MDIEGEVMLTLELMGAGAKDCKMYATKIEDKFHFWLELVCEVHMVTVAKEEQTAAGQNNNNAKLAEKSIEVKLRREEVTGAKAFAEEMKEQMQDAQRIFEKTADNMPTRKFAIHALIVQIR